MSNTEYGFRKIDRRQTNRLLRHQAWPMQRTSSPIPPRCRRSASTLASLMLVLVKILHTVVFVVVFGSILFLLYCGIWNHISRWTAIAFMLVFLEVTIYVGHGFKCPLKTLAVRLTPPGHPVHDIYLPVWLSRRVTAISTPLLVIDFLLLLVRLSTG